MISNVRVIAADIGGTNSRLGLIDLADHACILRQHDYCNADYDSFEAVLDEFLSQEVPDNQPASLVLAVPAPVTSGVTSLTNLDWEISEARLKEQFSAETVIINDLEAAALGTLTAPTEQLIRINDRPMTKTGKRIVIGSGTGLGVAWLIREKDGVRSYPTESGHIDFAPADSHQEALLHFLQKKYDHVSWERILSGPGIVDLYRFCSGQLSQDVSAGWVNQQALDGSDSAAEEAMHLFAKIYGAFAGNMVLTHRPIDGIFLVGGVSIKTRHWLQSDEFLQAFFAKGRMRHLAEETPVFLLPDEGNGLRGTIMYAETIFGINQQSHSNSTQNIASQS